MTEPPAGLSIGELARRTDVPVATLRSWESRYGFPRPHRAAGGHRRYSRSDIDLIEAVMRLRSSGISRLILSHPEPEGTVMAPNKKWTKLSVAGGRRPARRLLPRLHP